MIREQTFRAIAAGDSRLVAGSVRRILRAIVELPAGRDRDTLDRCVTELVNELRRRNDGNA